MARKYVLRFQLQGGLHYVRPIPDIAVCGVIERTVRGGIACAQDLLFRQVDKSISTRVRPAEEMKFHTARAVLHDERCLGESLLGWLRRIQIQLGDVLTRF